MSYGPLDWVHIISALSAILCGGVVVLSRKETPIHRRLGLAYVFASVLVDGARSRSMA